MFHCPLCGREFDPDGSDALPFCSQRCRQIDLGRWLDEKYSFPAVPKEDEPQQETGPE
jgi:uncharacterized protein